MKPRISYPHSFKIEEVHILTGKRRSKIKVKDCGICGSDLHFFNQNTKTSCYRHEFSGEVVEIGRDVSGVSRGTGWWPAAAAVAENATGAGREIISIVRNWAS